MPSRWPAWIVLGVATVVLALVGVFGLRQMLKPPAPNTLTELVEEIEATGFRCGSPAGAAANGTQLRCGDGSEAVQVTYWQASTGVRYSGYYYPLKVRHSELSGNNFEIVGPHAAVLRLHRRLGGDLQDVQGGQ